MTEFIEQNKRLLRLYGTAAYFLGNLLFGFGFLWGALFSVSIISRMGDRRALLEQVNQVPNGIMAFILIGLIAVGTSQFIRYLIENDYQPERLLRHGDKILYVSALLVVIHTCWLRMNHVPRPGPDLWAHYGDILEFVLLILITLTKVLTLMGLGRVLKRVMPIIRESKTLV